MEPKKTKKSLWLNFDRILSHDLGKQALILLGLLLGGGIMTILSYKL